VNWPITWNPKQQKKNKDLFFLTFLEEKFPFSSFMIIIILGDVGFL
jgi:hypothetical protein